MAEEILGELSVKIKYEADQLSRQMSDIKRGITKDAEDIEKNYLSLKASLDTSDLSNSFKNIKTEGRATFEGINPSVEDLQKRLLYLRNIINTNSKDSKAYTIATREIQVVLDKLGEESDNTTKKSGNLRNGLRTLATQFFATAGAGGSMSTVLSTLAYGIFAGGGVLAAASAATLAFQLLTKSQDEEKKATTDQIAEIKKLSDELDDLSRKELLKQMVKNQFEITELERKAKENINKQLSTKSQSALGGTTVLDLDPVKTLTAEQQEQLRLLKEQNTTIDYMLKNRNILKGIDAEIRDLRKQQNDITEDDLKKDPNKIKNLEKQITGLEKYEKLLKGIKDKSEDVKLTGDEKFIKDTLGSIDEYRHKLELLQKELSQLGSVDVEKRLIVHAQIVDLNEQLDNAELEIIRKVNGIKPKVKIDLEISGNKKLDTSTTLEKQKQAMDTYYGQLKTLSEDYFKFQIQKIEDEKKAFITATNDPILAKQLEIDKLKELEQEYFDWRMDQWKNQSAVTNEIFSSGLAGITAGYDTFWQSLANSDMSGAERSKAIWDSIKSAALTTFGDILKEYIANIVKQEVIGDTFKATELAKNTALATGLTAAYITPATLASIMSFGGAVATGEAALIAAITTSQALGTIPKFATGTDGYVNVPGGYNYDNYPILLKSGEDFNVRTPAQRSKDQADYAAVTKELKQIKTVLMGKDFSPAIFNTMTLNGRTIAKEVANEIKQMQKEGRKF